MTTNICESLNSKLKIDRDLPTASLLEAIREFLQRWFYERRKAASCLKSVLSSWAEGLIRKLGDESRSFIVNPVSEVEFQYYYATVLSATYGGLVRPIGNHTDWSVVESQSSDSTQPRHISVVERPKVVVEVDPLSVDSIEGHNQVSVTRPLVVTCALSGIRSYLLIDPDAGCPTDLCASFGSTRLICASFGSTRLICASFGSTRLICAFYGTTRLLCKGTARGRPTRGRKDA
ncbi:uncharacterized protein E6C27_scaffold138G00350 [Cucumis melo var. makuwa]|uniref:Uncharacterized protein n=1 Tax=Cucumis melo var. makuwa TaxID=1194695 RepID=A0A5A7VQJ1_CUCMM|nr:uncharacterized protein E6C27_scaffold138G00350 [Cucumis melo var. makuwa]